MLKNDGHLLPLDPAKIKTIAVIGPDAWPAVIGGGGSSEAQAFEPVSILTGIANLLGPSVHVLYSRGLPEMNEIFRSTQWEGSVKVASLPQHGLHRHTGDHNSSEDRRLEARVAGQPQDKAPRSIRYTASYKAAKAGKYTDSGRLSPGLGERRLQGDWSTANRCWRRATPRARFRQSATLELTAGQTVNVVAEFFPTPPACTSAWASPMKPDLISDEAKKIAAQADVVVVAVGFNRTTESEGPDRTFALPWGQDALIEAVAAANPHTIVTLTGGGGMDTRRWLDKVPALLHALLSRPGGRHGRRRGSLRQAQPRGQAAGQLRPQLGRESLGSRTTIRSRARTPRCT